VVGGRPLAHIYLSCDICAKWSLTTFFPFSFPGVFMRRGSVKKSQSVSSFKSRVGKTDSLNKARNRRGGIRL